MCDDAWSAGALINENETLATARERKKDFGATPESV